MGVGDVVKIILDDLAPTRANDILILDLCGGTGAWSRPYRNAGYDVRVVDMKCGEDVRLFRLPEDPVHGVLAAPDCTCFAVSGNRWHRSDDDMREALALVDACLRIAHMSRPTWWALENPVGTLHRWIGRPALIFQPCDYGDPYTKRTCVWGRFCIPKMTPVEPTLGSYMHTNVSGNNRERAKMIRSVTPAGFARAFFEANP